MGDSGRWPEASGLSPEGAHSFRAAFDAFRVKGEEWWASAELRAADLITSIQPNPASELRRQAVVDYVTKLIQSCVTCQVRVVRLFTCPLNSDIGFQSIWRYLKIIIDCNSAAIVIVCE